MPEILTDQQTESVVGHRRRLEPVTRAEEAAFLEDAVGGQVELAVDVLDLAVAHQDRAVVEDTFGVFLHQPEHDRHRAGGRSEALDLR